jgi:hypothetical protein
MMGITSWAEVCRISRRLCNSLGNYAEGLGHGGEATRLADGSFAELKILEYPDLSLVWMATDSIGRRRWVTEGIPAARTDSFDGEYLGWKEEQSKAFTWGSATSDASISAVKHEGKDLWIVTFTGAGLVDRESAYARIIHDTDWRQILNHDLPQRSEFIVAAYR